MRPGCYDRLETQENQMMAEHVKKSASDVTQFAAQIP